jgi:N-acetyl sugar amidotransferase
MDTSDPEIFFDADGICNHCSQFLEKIQSFKQNKRFGPDNLEKVIDNIKSSGKNKKYDAVLGISGGVDSCFAASILHQYNVRTLLVHMDNGWNSNQATQNIKNVADRYKFDYQSFVLDWEEFKDVQLAFLKASVVEAETPTDIAILGALHRVAAEHGVQYVISGGNQMTEGILPKMWHYDAKDTRYFNYIQKTFGKLKLKKFPSFGFYTESYFKFVKGIRIIYLLNYVAYNNKTAVQFLKNEIDWKDYGGKHHESHFTKFIQSYLLPKKFNIDYRRARLSSLICMNEISREEALNELEKPLYNEQEVASQKQYIAKKIGISIEEIQEIVDLPGKYYYMYPNDEKKLTFLYKLYKKYFTFNNMYNPPTLLQ